MAQKVQKDIAKKHDSTDAIIGMGGMTCFFGMLAAISSLNPLLSAVIVCSGLLILTAGIAKSGLSTLKAKTKNNTPKP